MKFTNFKNKKFHFIGCGGIGMTGLAVMLMEHGICASGSDIVYNKNSGILEKSGMKLFTEHSQNNLPYKNSTVQPEDCIIVYSSAITENNVELATAVKDKVICYKRGEFLALISTFYKKLVCIAGSHGKTSVTAILTDILLKTKQCNPGYYIGGYPVGYNKNASAGNGEILVAEVDESDLSLIHFKPDLAVILNITEDHAWNVGGRNSLLNGFYKFAEHSKYLLLGNSHIPESFMKKLETSNVNLVHAQKYNSIAEQFSGYQMDNLEIAVNAAVILGIEPDKAIKAALEFKGVDRRMSVRYQSDDLIIIEDYAHHPVEIKSVISAVKNKYKGKLQIVFQPHRYTRFARYFDEFYKELKVADFVFVLPVFAAWERQCASNELLEKFVNKLGKKSIYLNESWRNIADQVLETTDKKGIILLLGAGDIGKLPQEIITRLNNR